MQEQLTIEEAICQFRLATFQHLPYLSDMVYSLQPVERPGLGTMAVDKWGRLYYDPEFVGQLSKEEGAYVILHEVCHLVFGHHRRADQLFGGPPVGKQREDYNIAADIVVWELLDEYARAQGIYTGILKDLVTTPWAAEKYNKPLQPAGIFYNQTVEQNYAAICRAEEPEPSGTPEPDPSGTPGNNPGDSQDPGENPGEGQSDGEDPGENAGEGQGNGPAEDGEAPPKTWAKEPSTRIGGGSAADGAPHDYELPPDPNWESFVEEEILRNIEEKIEKQGYTYGSTAGRMKEVIKQRLRPAPDPWKKLTSLVGKVSANAKTCPTGTYSRSNRRQYSIPKMPRLKGNKWLSPTCVCCIDTSGSMTSECLRKAINAVNQGIKSLGSLRVIWGDTQVEGDVEMSKFTYEFAFKGRGGTDMSALLMAAEAHKPDAIVLVTDGYTPYPDKMCCPLIVALTDEGGKKYLPTYAKSILIPSK